MWLVLEQQMNNRATWWYGGSGKGEGEWGGGKWAKNGGVGEGEKSGRG